VTPKNPFLMLPSSPELDRLVQKSKQARKAVKKFRRKLEQAQKAKKLTEIRVLIGMAQVALSKAEFLAKTAQKG
jgi:hypothetical protein